MPSGVYKHRKYTIEEKKKRSDALLKAYAEGRKIPTPGLLGKHHKEESKIKCRKSHLKRKEILGYINSPETRKKMKEAHKGQVGEKSSNWQGGKSFELYGFDWTDLLKHSIRTRDCFVCQICKKHGWMVHHIDYNKKNNDPKNLVTLCNKCHSKTNGKREYWIKYLKIWQIQITQT
jgi:5-methylcytosine-specific restriction endonuclease McrA